MLVDGRPKHPAESYATLSYSHQTLPLFRLSLLLQLKALGSTCLDAMRSNSHPTYSECPNSSFLPAAASLTLAYTNTDVSQFTMKNIDPLVMLGDDSTKTRAELQATFANSVSAGTKYLSFQKLRRSWDESLPEAADDDLHDAYRIPSSRADAWHVTAYLLYAKQMMEKEKKRSDHAKASRNVSVSVCVCLSTLFHRPVLPASQANGSDACAPRAGGTRTVNTPSRLSGLPLPSHLPRQPPACLAA